MDTLVEISSLGEISSDVVLIFPRYKRAIE